jgi:hypothetical protein
MRAVDKLKALEHLARIAALFPQDRQYVTVNGTIEHEHRVNIEQLDDTERQKLKETLVARKAREIDHEPQ